MSEQWGVEYKKTLERLPDSGEILTTKDGSLAKLEFEINPGRVPFLYGLAYVPAEVGCELGWFLQSEESFGWKCIILPKAREDCIKRYGLQNPIYVKSLKVIRVSQTGRSLLCEINEYET